MIKPLPGYVLVSPIEEEEKTGEVYMPETSKDKPMKGKIIDFLSYTKTSGEKEWFNDIVISNLIKKGDIVIYKKWTNQEVKHEGKEYLLIHFNELLGVVE